MSRRGRISGAEWVWRDYLSWGMLAFMAVAALASETTPRDAQGQPPGVLSVILDWDTSRDIDVDLWVEGPNDAPVGYLRRTGKDFDLMHDHRGAHVEGNFDNREYASARETPPGQYIINATAFSSWDGVFPVHVTLTVTRNDPTRHTSTVLLHREGELKVVNDEITLAAFRLDDHGAIVAGSLNSNLVCLWKRC